MPNAIPSAQQLAGRVIDDGRMRLEEPLGHGSGGVVFRAVDLTSPTTIYAVKCMLKAEEGSKQRAFQKREIRFHSSVSSHPNIVTLHRVVEEGDFIFAVLEYCPGGDMFKYLTKRGTYVRNDALVKSVFCQLIDALEACHKAGVYHRDVKPENIMCNQEGTEIKLGDFGLSTDSEWSKNFGAGTAGYMSPECIGAEMGWHSYSPASNDVWSLGVILTSLISGHNPWRRAVTSDDCFRSYIRNPDFFRNMLPISPAADTILRGIFAPLCQRFTLAQLREQVLAVDTFFLTDTQIAESSQFVQLAAASYLCISSAVDSSLPSFEGIADVEVEGISHHSHPSPGPEPAQPQLERLRATKPPPPPPQPMPSLKEFMRPSSDSSRSSDQLKKSRRRSLSPTGFLRRMVDKIFMV